MIFHAQGRTGGPWGPKGAVQGLLMDPLDGPIAGLVERDTFVRTPCVGFVGCWTTATGQSLGRQGRPAKPSSAHYFSIYPVEMLQQPKHI